MNIYQDVEQKKFSIQYRYKKRKESDLWFYQVVIAVLLHTSK